ncbi:MAG: GT4 family glycosyltransferase PelF [Candidatus Riflebacteria bacterium]|nr:GT4 family glycosyltransferase PelF [Candidatus Riflebacteria bacterium]
MNQSANHRLPEVDVELLLEGSYPYVTGGVSSWVHWLIEGLPHIRFGLTHFAAKRDKEPQIKYQLPGNVLFLQNIYLHDAIFLPPGIPDKNWSEHRFYHELYRLHKEPRKNRFGNFGDLLQHLSEIRTLSSLKDLFFNRQSFALLTGLYNQSSPESSFIDFFWTWRFMHLPLVQLLQARRSPARLCHAICTGYAGFYGALRKATEGVPLLLTEHGIYTRERNIEITQADWIHSEKHAEHLVRKAHGTFKRLWLNFFEALGLYTYQMADRIITLYDGNRKAQLLFGAEAARIDIIPNGINLDRFLDLRSNVPPDPIAFRVGFVGRIVSIKDIKTLLKAAQLVLLRVPKASFWLIGPLDEEPEYSLEVQQMASDLQIDHKVHFLGRQNVLEYYPKLDVVVLTSISEGQPLSILEAMAAGVPNVATDVGGCRELLYGRESEDRILGPCGVITNLRSPMQTAEGIFEICLNPKKWEHMANAGKIRVKAYYRQSEVVARYKRLYERFMSKTPAISPSLHDLAKVRNADQLKGGI